MVVTGCQENKSCSKVLNFLERLDDTCMCGEKKRLCHYVTVVLFVVAMTGQMITADSTFCGGKKQNKQTNPNDNVVPFHG